MNFLTYTVLVLANIVFYFIVLEKYTCGINREESKQNDNGDGGKDKEEDENKEGATDTDNEKKTDELIHEAADVFVFKSTVEGWLCF